VAAVGEAAGAAGQVQSAARAAGRPVVEAAIDRAGPSAFFGTPLLTQLLPLGADTVVIVGGTASDSVRATVVDGYSYGLRMVVVEPSVTDDSDVARAYSLYDVMIRYGTVFSLAEALAGLGSPEHKHDDHAHHHHEHAHGHGHVVHQSADGRGSDAHPDLALPAVLRSQLPANARPVSMSEYPVHGHVLRRAGQGLLDAAGTEMSAGFGDLPHAVAVLTDETLDRDDDPRYREALRMTEGGAILIGVGYQESESITSDALTEAGATGGRDPADSVDPGPCPECGSTSHSIDEVVPVNATQGLHTGVVVFVCDRCGAAWDIPFGPEAASDRGLR
jgi:hypothetical protein